MSEVEDETSSSSEDEEPELDETNDRYFFKALSCLKNKDPKIYNPSINFFPKDDGTKAENGKTPMKNEKSKGIFLRDYEREAVIKAMNEGKGEEKGSDADDDPDESLPYVEQQKNLKASFKAVLENSDSSDDEHLFTVKKKTAEDKAREEEEYTAWLKGNRKELSDKETEKDLKPLHEFWSKPDLDSGEQFLRDYILNKRYLEENEVAEDDGISEDGELLEMQEKFETDYNMRFENESNTETKRYPRVIEGSLRKKNENRQKKRKERLERKRAEKEKMKEDIARKQKEKLEEFKEQVEKIKLLTGNDQLGFRDEEIFGDDDFDPEAHDRKMQELYSDAFYAAGDDDVKPEFADEGDIAGWEDEEVEADPDNMDLDAPGPSASKKETRSKRKRKEKKKKAFTDILDVVKPVFDPNVHDSFQKYIDDYYGMDCEDFIEDIPCRYKYREVVPNDFGLSVGEILAADDKELNQWVSTKKIVKLRPDHVEKNEVHIYKKKAQDFQLKKKILSSLYASPEREDSDPESGERRIHGDGEEKNESEISGKKGRNGKITKKPKDVKRGADEISHQGEGDSTVSGVPTKKRKTDQPLQADNKHPEHQKHSVPKGKSKPNQKRKNRRAAFEKSNKNGTMEALSDLRLKAYEIKPKEFKKKLKFKKT